MKKKDSWRNALWTTNHSPLYYGVLFLWLVLFAAGFVFLNGQPKASPIIYAYIALMMLIWLFGFIIQIRERRGLPTLPGRDFRRHVNDVQENLPTHYRLSDDGEIVELPEKPKRNLL